jgi:hypothetical protein
MLIRCGYSFIGGGDENLRLIFRLRAAGKRKSLAVFLIADSD